MLYSWKISFGVFRFYITKQNGLVLKIHSIAPTPSVQLHMKRQTKSETEKMAKAINHKTRYHLCCLLLSYLWYSGKFINRDFVSN